MKKESHIYDSVLRWPVKEDFRQTFPRELPSRIVLDKLRPRYEWAIESLANGLDRSLWKSHGDGHIARLVIFHQLLIRKMGENKTLRLTKEQIAAIELSVITHDLRYNFDRRETIFEKTIVKHQEKAADQKWLERVFFDLAKGKVNSFAEVSSENVVPLASQINRVHDYMSDATALTVLRSNFPGRNIKEIPLELSVFKDIDSGLERLRTEEILKKIINWVVVTRPFKGMILRLPKIKKTLNLFHFPQFEETRQLLPFSFELYHQSRKNPEFKKDQWKATMDTAQALDAIKG